MLPIPPIKRVLVFVLGLCSFAASVTAQTKPVNPADTVAPGRQRMPFPYGQTQSITGLSFINPDTGWVCGINGAFVTYDGGNHWIRRVDVATCGYGQVKFFDAKEGWLLVNSFGAKLMHTTDGGSTWDTLVGQNTNAANGMTWFGRDTAYVYGAFQISKLTRTPLGWHWDFADKLDAGEIRAIGRFDAAHLIALGDHRYANGNPNSATVLRSDDTGRTWYAPSGLSFTGAFLALIVVDSQKVIGLSSRWRSNDRGSSWTADTTIPRYCECASFPTGQAGYVGGGYGLIAFSNDSGRTWSQQVTNTRETIT